MIFTQRLLVSRAQDEDNEAARQRQRPFATAQAVVRYYKDKFPRAFSAKPDPKVLQVQ